MDLYPETGKVFGDFSNLIFYKFLEKIKQFKDMYKNIQILNAKSMHSMSTMR